MLHINWQMNLDWSIVKIMMMMEIVIVGKKIISWNKALAIAIRSIAIAIAIAAKKLLNIAICNN